MLLYSKLSLLLCLLIHVQFVFYSNWIGYATQGILPLIWNLFQGFSYLLYPICGWIAEVFFTNFKMIKVSFVLMLASSIAGFIFAVRIAFSFPPPSQYICAACVGLILVSGLMSLGMYEANAIQFGMDQMIEASSEQLSSFIHWYFWCSHVGPLIQYYALIGLYLCIYDCWFEEDKLSNEGFTPLIGWILLFYSCFQIILTVPGIFISFCSKRWLSIEETRKNPLKNVYRVLIYSYKHRYPERRSAFTYWENSTPSRIDLAKEKYGGPFTYEEVEDVKSMLRLLLLIGALFGFHLSGDGYSLSYFVMKRAGCPSALPLAVSIINPQHITLLVVLFGIPLHHFFKKQLSSIYMYTLSNSLMKLWTGLLLCLLSECLQCNYSLMLQSKDFLCVGVNTLNPYYCPLSLECLAANFRIHETNGSCQYFCITPPVHDQLFYLSIVPLLLNGLAYLLVFMTTIEFICAQSPNSMKGLLIGIWYSMLSFKCMIINNLDIYPPLLKPNSWSIYHGIKGIGMFLSILLFSVVCKHYQYRERDEIVNEQAMIEEQYERELLLNQHERETGNLERLY